MANVTEDRDTNRRGPFTPETVEIAANTEVFFGALALADAAGRLDPAGTYCIGLILGAKSGETLDNSTGAAGDNHAIVGWGPRFRATNLVNSSSDPVTAASFGAPGFAEDDQTISIFPGSGPHVGTIRGLSGGVVEISLEANLG